VRSIRHRDKVNLAGPNAVSTCLSFIADGADPFAYPDRLGDERADLGTQETSWIQAMP
jgi:hypothetical protein